MIARPHLARPPVLSSLIAALLSAAISTGLLGAVGGLFQSDGVPFGRTLAAERDCADYAFVSEREACIRIETAGQASPDLGFAAHPQSHDRRLKEKLADSGERIEFDCAPIAQTGGQASRGPD